MDVKMLNILWENANQTKILYPLIGMAITKKKDFPSGTVDRDHTCSAGDKGLILI